MNRETNGLSLTQCLLVLKDLDLVNVNLISNYAWLQKKLSEFLSKDVQVTAEIRPLLVKIPIHIWSLFSHSETLLTMDEFYQNLRTILTTYYFNPSCLSLANQRGGGLFVPEDNQQQIAECYLDTIILALSLKSNKNRFITNKDGYTILDPITNGYKTGLSEFVTLLRMKHHWQIVVSWLKLCPDYKLKSILASHFTLSEENSELGLVGLENNTPHIRTNPVTSLPRSNIGFIQFADEYYKKVPSKKT
jgi:hypothetical protein